MMEKLFKVLGNDGMSCHGGSGKWSLPRDGKPGEWMPPIKGELVPCENGYHLCRESDLIDWLNVTILEAEYQGERIDCDDKVVVCEARLVRRVETWNERTARLFACDCAERVLCIFERDCSDDDRPREAIKVARQFANGVATQEELNAARTAAKDAASEAANAAAWGAARGAVCATAWAAAKDAANAAANAAVCGTAKDAVRDAASEAARSAVRAAARAAASEAASDADRVATSAAACGTAKDAEQKWQLAQLMKYLYPVEGQDLRVEMEGTFDIDGENN